jgi:PAS domain S-box-containing protein
MVGLSREAQAGKTLGQLQPGYIGSAAFEWHRQALDADTPLLREESEYAPTSSGPRLQAAYEVRAAALGAGRLALVWREITDRKRAENQLRLRAEAVASEAEGVCIVRGATGMVAYANARFEEMLGYGPGELEGRTVSELDWSDPPLDFGFPTIGRWPLGAREQRSVVRCRPADGGELWCEVLVEGFEDPDLGWCWVASHRDVTAQRAEREHLEASREYLREALDSLPLLAYCADPDLRCTVLVDGLTPRGVRAVSRGGDADIFGATLGESVREVNRRVLVTRRATRVEVRADLPGHPTVLLAVDPVLGADGEVVRLVGAALDHATLAKGHDLSPGLGRRHSASSA